MYRIQDFSRQFGNSNTCLDYLFDRQYPHVVCSSCQRTNAYHRNRGKPCYTCNCGQSHIFPKKNTIFEASPIPLHKWFYALYLMTQTANGVTAKELERQLDVTYPTAWRMAKKIRAAMPTGEFVDHKERFERLLDACVPAVEKEEKVAV